MMEQCYRCGSTEEEVRLFDGVDNNELVKVCESCALHEDLPIIKRPTTLQLKESEKPYSVYERLRRMAGIHSEEKEKISKIARGMIEVKKEEEEEKGERGKKGEDYRPLKLIDNFHWHILMARKKKKLDRKQLADLLGESEAVIRMAENKELPHDAFKLIRKLEQFFGIRLRKEEGEAEEERAREAVKKRLEETEKKPSVILKIDRENINNLTIADLKKIKDEKARKEVEDAERKMDAGKLVQKIEKEEREKEEKKWKEETENSLLGEDVEFVD
ncbi:MAG: hypothetical protein AABX71_00320 [Nanoarchaeota archaeon]